MAIFFYYSLNISRAPTDLLAASIKVLLPSNTLPISLPSFEPHEAQAGSVDKAPKVLCHILCSFNTLLLTEEANSIISTLNPASPLSSIHESNIALNNARSRNINNASLSANATLPSLSFLFFISEKFKVAKSLTVDKTE